MLMVLAIASLGFFLVLPLGVAAPACAVVLFGIWYVRRAIARSVRFPPLTGVESMPGRVATVVAPLAPVGTIRYQGELWRAVCGRPMEAGARVRILRVERQPGGFTVLVEPPEPAAGG